MNNIGNCFNETILSQISIIHASLNKQTLKLEKPYILSFGTVTEITSLRVKLLTSDYKALIAEVVPLYGYVPESEKQIITYLKDKIGKITGMNLYEARKEIKKDIKNKPFSTTAILTAIDHYIIPWKKPDVDSVDFVIPCSTRNIPELDETINDTLNKNRTIKIKLCGKLDEDIYGLSSLKKHNGINKTCIRLDANQAYEYREACELFSWLDDLETNNIDYVEQPLRVNLWKEHGNLINRYKTRIMLDESIIDIEDLVKAKSINCQLVKLKLFKQGGIRELLELTETANKYNMLVVMGNGVSSEIGNGTEIYLHNKYKKYYYGASEANGFLKVIK